MEEERIFWVAWAQIPGVGSILLQRLQQHFGSLAVAWSASAMQLAQVQGFGRQLGAKITAERSRLNPETRYRQHLQKNPQFWTPADPDYPRLLLEIPDPPPLLYYRGQIDREENLGIRPLVGIVGTRHPSEYGKRWTRRMSAVLAKCGFTVVSGMAAGIDSEAHIGCIESACRTIAVFGTHLDKIYPVANRTLFQKIVSHGLVLSEHPSGTRTRPEHFAQRNRIIAGLSRAVLVMEAPQRSGALITARVANEFGRDVFALPGRLEDYTFQGCLRLLKNGAEMIVNEEELVAMLGGMPKLDHPQQLSLFQKTPASETSEPSASPAASMPELEPQLQRVWKAIATEDAPFDAIVEAAAMDAATVSSALLQLELLGYVEQLPGMRYRRS
ncbi:DNA-processing protein DprA [Phormidium sp. CCY1219]|uniref:DNA-processing protein DprA n=1 Tax=Phormidium sp. CCY1219 TaxID=2886104 RepID=UPI002D1E6F19|nr:DNA-processing protein DprA [Phormidium sp. CCY1219]MEB3829728.1 DNA-processing protein DprA [Phormidium sp. CCY1219]